MLNQLHNAHQTPVILLWIYTAVNSIKCDLKQYWLNATDNREKCHI